MATIKNLTQILYLNHSLSQPPRPRPTRTCGVVLSWFTLDVCCQMRTNQCRLLKKREVNRIFCSKYIHIYAVNKIYLSANASPGDIIRFVS